MSSVLVFLEIKDRAISRISWEAMAAAHTLAAALGLPVDLALVASPDNPILATIHGKAPHTVYAIDHTLLHGYTADGYTAACVQLIDHAKPSYVIFPHTYQVRDFAPKLATRFGEVLISDVTGIGPGPVFTRQLLQGKLNAEYHHTGTGPCFLSIQAGAFRADEPVAGTTTIEPFQPNLDSAQIRVHPGELFDDGEIGLLLDAAAY
jgi:electron transfer flavoprotein alpha subunit